jgi:hypothetical protein
MRGASAIVGVLIFTTRAFATDGLAAQLQPIARDDLCVTNGAVSALPGDRLGIDTPSSRAVLGAGRAVASDQVAEIRFRYLGPSAASKPLASGELRRQIGLKLRAADTCNLIYAMWHIEPDAAVAVSIKRNPGMHRHEQCHAGGYINLKRQKASTLAPIRAGEAHILRAELHGNDLKVTADGNLAWQGALRDAASSLVGPAGFRTDNARFELGFYADAPSRAGAAAPSIACVKSEGD